MKVEIDIEELDNLKSCQTLLVLLHEHGVDNWEHYDTAMQELADIEMVDDIIKECGDAGHR
jgi:hypothetical protein